MENGKAQPTIMVVDDNLINLKLLDKMLCKFSYRVVAFSSAELALTAAAIEAPDIFLLDIAMPGMSGLELCEKLKLDKDLSEIPVIFISAMTDISEKIKAFRTGGVDYICNPFQLEEVRARIETHLGLRRLSKELETHIELLDAANHELTNSKLLMDEQLTHAKKIQCDLLPSILPISKHVNFHWRCEPCDQLAGDSLNIFWLDKTHIVVYLFDVAGHGVAAALMAVSVSRILQPTNSSSSVVMTQGAETWDVRPKPPATVATELNLIFPWTDDSPQFFTLVYNVLDVNTLEFCYVNAGHLDPVHITPEGKFESLRGTGLPIGLDGNPYKEQSVQLRQGSRLIIYSDGITEVMNDKRELWNYERLCETLLNNASNSLDECLDDIIIKADLWSGKATIIDDRTILGIEILEEAAIESQSVKNLIASS